MANTYTLISSVTVGSGGAANMSFTSIPQTYTDLLVSYSSRSQSGGTAWLNVTLNTGGTYTIRNIFGTGSVVNSDNSVFIANNNPSYTANVFSNGQIYIPNYTSSNAKSMSGDGVNENNATQVETAFGARLWSGTAAVTTVTLADLNATNFAQYSTAYLYGISNA